MLAQGFKMVGRAVALVSRQTVLRINGVPLFHASVSMCFRKDRSCRDGDAAGVSFNKGFLLDQDFELHGVNEQVVGWNCQLQQRGGHRLARRLVNVPRIDALRVYFRNSPRQ